MMGTFSVETFLDRAFSQVQTFTTPGSRLFWGYMASALVLAVAAYFKFRSMREGEARPEKVERGLFSYIFDRSVFLHRSAVQDYVYLIVNTVIYGGIVSQLIIGGNFLFVVFMALLTKGIGPLETPLFAAGPGATALYTLAAVLLFDFAVFITHYLQHKMSPLWEFHKVHHSAEVLTPITFARMHPVDLFFTGVATVVFGAFGTAVFAYLTGTVIQPITVVNLNIVIFVFYVLGYHLRHSHIWLSYPVWLSHILISPAQHQIHHSLEGRHWDKNLGLIFAVWDWMFGTLYVPRGYENIRYGVSRDEPNPFPSILAMYVKPFRAAWAAIAPIERNLVRRAAMGAWVVFGLTAYYGVFSISVAERGYAPPSLLMEELTWPEIEQAIAAGYTQVIVPTGGVEENGLHAVLGKHNYVVHETSQRIAEAVGHTLIAPVITLVPEGNPGPDATGNMRYPGTISLPEPVFEAVLTATVESLRSAGFTRVFFVGDHGWSQTGQENVARAFQEAGKKIEVYQVGAYYHGHGQEQWLFSQGFDKATVGNHAGIRDTSEMLVVDPDGVRKADAIVQPLDPSRGTGANGDWHLATPEIGRKMLDLKVAAGVRQIEEIMAQDRRGVSLGN